MNASHVKESLFSLTSKGIKYDLDRITGAAAAIGNPHDTYPSFHVAGTNGKGSTCAYIESVLRTAGYKTGLFTSPHLLDFEERFRINNKPVPESEWLDVYSGQQQIIHDFRLTFFEATMLIAIELFRKNSIDWAIFETGMGGRLDATNIVTPEVSVITRLAMDHHEYLGNTIEKVAGEKLGIVKHAVPLVAIEPTETSVRHLFIDTCRNLCAPYIPVTQAFAGDIKTMINGTQFTFNKTAFTTNMAGRFQVQNALCALAAIEAAHLEVADEQKLSGIRSMNLPGRFEQLEGYRKSIILDVGHNPDAATVFCATLRNFFPHQKICIVTGIMADKEYAAMINLYAEHASHLILTRPAIDRAATAENLAASAPSDHSSIIPDVATAVRVALDRPEPVVAIVGSFHTVGEAVLALKAEHTSSQV